MIITPLLDTLKLEKIDDSIYFSTKYSNYISNSRLGLINPNQGGSPESFFNGFKPIYSSSLDLGSTVHQMCLQRDLFTICNEVDKPSAKMGILADKLYKDYDNISPELICKVAGEIDYYHGLLSEKQVNNVIEKCTPYWNSRKRYESIYTGTKEVIFLEPKLRETAYNCINAIESNKKIQNLLHPIGLLENPLSENEQAILLDIRVDIPENDKHFILKLKSKLDNYTIDKESNVITVNDIKTLGRVVSEVSVNIEKYHYNRELAMYSFLLSLVAKKYYNLENPKVKGNYLVVSTIPQYYTKVVPMTVKMFTEGWMEFKKLLTLVATEVSTNYKEFGIWM